MNNYIDSDFNFFSINVKDNEFHFYKNEQLVLQGNMKPLKELGLPVRPFEYKDCYILLDYYKGVKIYKNSIEYFFKLTSIFNIGTINNYIIFFGQKKMHIMDIDTLKIINEINRSENLQFCKNNNYALFYRFKNNKSYLIDLANNKIIHLNNFMKDDVLIHKIYVNNGNLYVLMSEKSILKVIKYNFIDLKTIIIEDNLCELSKDVTIYWDWYTLDINQECKKIETEVLNYIEYLCYIYRKYGFYIAMLFVHKNKINEYKETKYCNIVYILEKLIYIINKISDTKTYKKLELLKNKLMNLQIILDAEFSKFRFENGSLKLLKNENYNYIEYLLDIYKKYGFSVMMTVVNIEKLKEYDDIKYINVVIIIEKIFVVLNKEENLVMNTIEMEKMKKYLLRLKIELGEEIQKVV